MKILLVNDYGRPTAGAEIQMLALRAALVDRGHEVTLFTSDAALAPGLALDADQSCRGRNDRLQAFTQTMNFDAVRRLRRVLEESRPDVIHVRMFLWQLSPLILPLLREFPALYQAAVYKAVCPNGLKLLPDGEPCGVQPGVACFRNRCVSAPTWLSSMAQLALVKRWRDVFDIVAALSPRMADLFREAGWARIEVLGNGIDNRRPRPLLQGPPIIGYAGRLAREKGLHVLLSAFLDIARRVPDVRLLIAGSGPLEGALRAQAAAAGDRVNFLGQLSRGELERAFDTVWVQAVPSLWQEPFGNVSIEAMMRGTAVVASAVGGQVDVVRDGQSGFLVPPGDASALAEKLGILIGDRGLAEAFGRRGRNVALAEYSREAAIDALEDAYRRAISNFGARRGTAS